MLYDEKDAGQALELIDRVTSNFQGTRQDHALIQQSLEVLRGITKAYVSQKSELDKLSKGDLKDAVETLKSNGSLPTEDK